MSLWPPYDYEDYDDDDRDLDQEWEDEERHEFEMEVAEATEEHTEHVEENTRELAERDDDGGGWFDHEPEQEERYELAYYNDEGALEHGGGQEEADQLSTGELDLAEEWEEFFDRFGDQDDDTEDPFRGIA